MNIKACLPALFALLTAAPAFANGSPFDWPHWRGPEMNGISREKGIVEKWSPKGENLLWKSEELAGRSTPIVMNGKLYTIVPVVLISKFKNSEGDEEEEREIVAEKVVCVDAATGKKIWQNQFNVYLSDVPAPRVGWSSVVGDPSTGHVFALGVCGYFQCLDGNTGKTIWKHSLSEEYGLLSTYGGRTNFPIIQGDLVIISAIVIGWGEMAKPAHRFIAFDKRNGQPVWFNGTRLLPYDTTYSSPVATVINGQPLIIFGSGDGGIHAMQPQTGKRVWTYHVSRRGISTTPLVIGNTVICGHSEENLAGNLMGALFAIDATKSGDITAKGELWRFPEWSVGKSSPLHVNGRIYACEDKGTLLIVDLKTGRLISKMKLGIAVRSSPLYADGKIFICTENTRWWTLKPTEKGVDVLHDARLSAGSCYGSPIVSNGRMYVPTTQALFCVGTKDQKPSADPLPAPPKEASVDDDPKPAWLQVVPVESLLRPGKKGQRQQFDVRLYNSRGQWLKTVDGKDVEFSVEGPGSIDASGKYTTPKQPIHGAAIVTAKVGDLTGQARIRVVPDLSWSFDFDDGQVPITWVGARYRNIAVDFDLFKSLEKQNPMAGQLYIYLMTSFINSDRPAVTYDNSTPRQVWAEFLRFLELLETVKTLDEAKAAVDPAFQLLLKEKVVAKWEWAEPEGIGIRLSVTRGPRKVDGNGVMCKIKTIPKGARSQGWMGQTHFRNYTVQADVLGAIKKDKTPDIGLIAQRYAIRMRGEAQDLQVYSWPTELRMGKTIPFEWQPNVWYTIKLQTEVKGKTTVVRGKVWPRDKKEPKNWAIEAVDEMPNVNGSPGIYGNAINAEIFYDNFKVTPNESVNVSQK